MRTKKLTTLAISVSLAMILSFVESLIPPLTAVPGIKLGLANVASLFALYALGAPSAIAVSLVRVCLSALLFGSAVSLIYSLCGAALSLAVMILFKKIKMFSIVGVSVLGAVFHNVGQVLAAIAVMQSAAIAVYLPPLLISGVVTGIIVGVLAGTVLSRVKKIFFNGGAK